MTEDTASALPDGDEAATSAPSLLAFPNWLEQNQATVKEPLQKYRGYSDYVKQETLAQGRYSDTLVAKLDAKLAGLAVESGDYALPEGATEYNPADVLARPKSEEIPAKSILNFAFSPDVADDDPLRQATAKYEALRRLRDEGRSTPEELAAAEADLRQLATPEVMSRAVRKDVKEGRSLAAIVPPADPEGRPTLEINDSLLELRDENGNIDMPALGKTLKMHGTDPSLIPGILDRLTRPEGYAKTKVEIERHGEAMSTLDTLARTADPDNRFAVFEELGKIATSRERGNTYATEYGVFNLRRVMGEQAKGKSDAELLTLADDFNNMNAMPELDEADPAKALRTLSTGQVVTPLNLMLNDTAFEKAVNDPSVPLAQRDHIRLQRDYAVEASASDIIRTIADNPQGGDEFVAYMDAQRAAGVKDSEIVKGWIGMGKFSTTKSTLAGLRSSLGEAVMPFVALATGLDPDGFAIGAMKGAQIEDANRRAYADLFGKSHGMVYDLGRLVAPVAVDLGASFLTRGVATGAVAVGKATAGTAVRNVMKTALTAPTRSIMQSWVKAAATSGIKSAGLKVTGRETVDEVVSMAGRDIVSKIGTGVGYGTSIATGFNRSALSTYASLSTALSNQTNPDGTPKYTQEEVREIAMTHGLAAGTITAGVMVGFFKLGAPGMEMVLRRGLTNGQYARIAGRLKKDVAGFGAADANAMIAQFVKQGVTPLFKSPMVLGAVQEGAEEGLDEFMQYFNEAIATGDKISIADAAKQAFYAAALGGIMGGTTTGVGAAVTDRKTPPAQVEADIRRERLLEMAGKLEATAPQTAQVFRNYAFQQRTLLPQRQQLEGDLKAAKTPEAKAAIQQKIDTLNEQSTRSRTDELAVTPEENIPEADAAEGGVPQGVDEGMAPEGEAVAEGTPQRKRLGGFTGTPVAQRMRATRENVETEFAKLVEESPPSPERSGLGAGAATTPQGAIESPTAPTADQSPSPVTFETQSIIPEPSKKKAEESLARKIATLRERGDERLLEGSGSTLEDLFEVVKTPGGKWGVGSTKRYFEIRDTLGTQSPSPTDSLPEGQVAPVADTGATPSEDALRMARSLIVGSFKPGMQGVKAEFREEQQRIIDTFNAEATESEKELVGMPQQNNWEIIGEVIDRVSARNAPPTPTPTPADTLPGFTMPPRKRSLSSMRDATVDKLDALDRRIAREPDEDNMGVLEAGKQRLTALLGRIETVMMTEANAAKIRSIKFTDGKQEVRPSADPEDVVAIAEAEDVPVVEVVKGQAVSNPPPSWMSQGAIDEALASLKPSGIIALPKSAYADIPENLSTTEKLQYARQIDSWARRANDIRRGYRIAEASPQQPSEPPVGSVGETRDDRGTQTDAGTLGRNTVAFPDVSGVPAFKRFQTLFGTDIQSAVRAGFITEEKSFASNKAGAKSKVTGYSLRDGREFTSAAEAMKAYLSKAPGVSAKQVEISGIKLPEGYVKQGELYVYQPTTPQTNATQEGNITEGNQREYQAPRKGGKTDQAGGGNRAVEGGQGEKTLTPGTPITFTSPMPPSFGKPVQGTVDRVEGGKVFARVGGTVIPGVIVIESAPAAEVEKTAEQVEARARENIMRLEPEAREKALNNLGEGTPKLPGFLRIQRTLDEQDANAPNMTREEWQRNTYFRSPIALQRWSYVEHRPLTKQEASILNDLRDAMLNQREYAPVTGKRIVPEDWPIVQGGDLPTTMQAENLTGSYNDGRDVRSDFAQWNVKRAAQYDALRSKPTPPAPQPPTISDIIADVPEGYPLDRDTAKLVSAAVVMPGGLLSAMAANPAVADAVKTYAASKGVALGDNLADIALIMGGELRADSVLAELRGEQISESRPPAPLDDMRNSGGVSPVAAEVQPMTFAEIGAAMQDMSDDARIAFVQSEVERRSASDPNVGMEWASPYGRQRIIGWTNSGGTLTLTDPRYEVETVGSGEIRTYSAKKIQEVIDDGIYRLSPEYAQEQARQAQRQAEAKHREEEAAAQKVAAEQRMEPYLDSATTTPLQKGKLKSTLSEIERRNVSSTGKKYFGTRFEVVAQMVADGYTANVVQVPGIKDVSRAQFNRMDNREQQAFARRKAAAGTKPEYRLAAEGGAYFKVTKAEYDLAVWLKENPISPTDTPRNLPSSTPSSVVTDELDKFGFSEGLATFLTNVAKRGSKGYRGLAKLLLDAGAANVDTRLVNLPNTEAAGFYVGANGVVHINTAKNGPRGAVDTVLHELVHAVTEGSLRNPTPAQQKVIARIERVRATVTKRAKANGTFDNDLRYALGDNAEFLTHFFTSQRFRDQVSAMTPKSEKNWLQVIADLIVDLIAGRTKAQRVEAELRKELTTLITAPRIGLAPSDVVMRLPDAGTRFQFAGEKANTPQFMRDSLDTAKTMAAAGKDSEEIRAVTGWFPGKYDGKMRWEIPDAGAKWSGELDWQEQGKSNGQTFYGAFSNAQQGDFSKMTLPLSDFLDHPALYAAYPELKDLPVRSINLKPAKAAYGMQSISIDYDAKPKDALSSILHEIQHWVQEKEGFAKGSSPEARAYDKEFSLNQEDADRVEQIKGKISELSEQKRNLDNANRRGEGGWQMVSRRQNQIQRLDSELDVLYREERTIMRVARDTFGFDAYRRTAGEIEARDVQARANMTPEQLASTAPYSSENIALEDAIVLMGSSSDIRFQPASDARNVARFHQLTESLYRGRDEATAAEIEAWKEANPGAWEELSAMREEVLLAGGWDVKAYRGDDSGRTVLGSTVDHSDIPVVFATSSEKVAATYGNEAKPFFVKNPNPYRYNAGHQTKAETFNVEDVQYYVQEEGRSGAVITDVIDIPDGMLDDMTPSEARGYASDIHVLFDPTQIKSADPISPGPRITPDRWADAASPDIRFQPAARNTDADYIAAVEAGDMETAQRMVDEAARAAGYSQKVSHGTDEARNLFDGGAYFTDSRRDASAYAELRALKKAVDENDELSEIVGDVLAEMNGEELTDLGPQAIRDIADANGIDLAEANGAVISGYLRFSNPLDITDLGTDVGDIENTWDFLQGRGLLDEAWTDLDEDVQDELRDQYSDVALYRFLEGEGVMSRAFDIGHDVVIFDDISPDGGSSHTSWLTQDANQFKSADPVTYDDAGNVIPLSQRFQSTSPDIRFQGLTEQDFTPANLRDTATGFLPDDVTLDDLTIDFADLADITEGLDPINAENAVHAAVNHALARRAGEAAIPAPARSEFDSDEAFDAATREHAAEVARLTDTYELITRGRLTSEAMFRYRTNPGALQRLVDYLTAAIKAAYNRFTARYDTATAVALNRMSRDLAKARTGFNHDIEPSRGYDSEAVMMLPAADQDMPDFYSQLERVIEAKTPNRATPQQIMATIDPTRGSGVKAEEIKWSGIEAWLSGKEKVDKAELLKWLRDEGAVRFEEVTMGGVTKQWAQTDIDRLEREARRTRDWTAYEQAVLEYEDQQLGSDANQTGNQTKFGQYTLPGGENYREVVLAMPTEGGVSKQEAIRLRDQAWSKIEQLPDFPTGTNPLYQTRWVEENHPEFYAEWSDFSRAANNKSSEVNKNVYTSSHFPDIPNYVAHMRLNERTDAAGAPGLFIEEIQSDRHQEGRKRGYSGDMKDEIEAQKNALLAQEKEQSDIMGSLEPLLTWTHNGMEVRANGYLSVKVRESGRWEKYSWDWRAAAESNAGLTEERGQAYMDFMEAKHLRDEYARKAGNLRDEGIPDAPFRTTWPLAMFKRALRDAVASGKEWIGWTVGETQNDRFDLSKQVHRVLWEPREGGRGNLRVLGKESNTLLDQEMEADKVEDYIGKEAAARLFARPVEKSKFFPDTQTLEGDGLKVGGSGMKGFYDIMLPKEIGKYVKQWGGKVEKDVLPHPDPNKSSYAVVNQRDGRELGRFDDLESAKQFEEGDWKVVLSGSSPIWRIDITPTMRESVSTQGQVRFQPATQPASPATQPASPARQEQQLLNAEVKNDGWVDLYKNDPSVLATADKPEVKSKFLRRVVEALVNPFGALSASATKSVQNRAAMMQTVDYTVSTLGKRLQKAIRDEEADMTAVKLAVGNPDPLLTPSDETRIADNFTAEVDRVTDEIEATYEEELTSDPANAEFNRAVAMAEMRREAERNRKIAIWQARTAEANRRREQQLQALAQLERTAPDTYEAIIDLRGTVNKLQRLAREVNADSPAIQAIIDQSQGVYLVRSFAVHQDPKQIDLMMNSQDPLYAERREALTGFFRDKAYEQIMGELERDPDFLRAYGASYDYDKVRMDMDERAREGAKTRAQDMFEDFMLGHERSGSSFGQGSTVSNEIQRYMAKTNMPQEFLDALMVNEDPVFNLANTAMSLGRLVYNARMLQEIHDSGVESGRYITEAEKESGVTYADGKAEMRRVFSIDGSNDNIKLHVLDKITNLLHGELKKRYDDGTLDADPDKDQVRVRVATALRSFADTDNVSLADLLPEIGRMADRHAVDAFISYGNKPQEVIANLQPRRGRFATWNPLVSANAGNAAFKPLGGLYADPEQVEAFAATFRTNAKGADHFATKALDVANRSLIGMAGASLAIATQGSPSYYVRNIVGNVFYGLINGVSPLEPQKVTLAARAAKSMLSERGEISAEFQELIAGRIVFDAAKIGYLKQLIEDMVANPNATMQDIVGESVNADLKMQGLAKSGKAKAKAFMLRLGKFAEMTEVLSTVMIYADYKNILTEAGFGTEKEIIQEASRLTKRHTPGRSETASGVNAFTRTGFGAFLAPFLRFKADNIRILPNIWMDAMTWSRSENPVLRKAGQRKLAAATATMGLITIALPLIFQRAVAGLGDDEDRAIRASLPEYYRNSSLFYFRNKTNDGFNIVNLTYTNPLSFVGDPVSRIANAVMTGNVQDIPAIMGRFVAEDFIGENIAASNLIDVARNIDSNTNYPIYFEADTSTDKVIKSALHILRSYNPRIVLQGLRFVDSLKREGEQDFWYSPLGVAFATVAPFRPVSVSFDDMERRAFSSVRKENAELWRITSRIFSPAPLAPGDAEEMYEKRTAIMERQAAKALDIYEGFSKIRNGDTTSVERSAVSAGISKTRARLLFNRGVTERLKFPDDDMRHIRQLDPARYAEVIESVRSQPRFIPVER